MAVPTGVSQNGTLWAPTNRRNRAARSANRRGVSSRSDHRCLPVLTSRSRLGTQGEPATEAHKQSPAVAIEPTQTRASAETEKKYDAASYRRTMARACEKGFPPPAHLDGDGLQQWVRDHHWHPYQLRDSFATRIRKHYDLEASRILCGHRSLAMAETYAEVDRKRVQGIMSDIG